MSTKNYIVITLLAVVALLGLFLIFMKQAKSNLDLQKEIIEKSSIELKNSIARRFRLLKDIRELYKGNEDLLESSSIDLLDKSINSLALAYKEESFERAANTEYVLKTILLKDIEGNLSKLLAHKKVDKDKLSEINKEFKASKKDIEQKKKDYNEVALKMNLKISRFPYSFAAERAGISELPIFRESTGN